MTDPRMSVLVRETRTHTLIRWLVDADQRAAIVRSYGFHTEPPMPLTAEWLRDGDRVMDAFESLIEDEIDRRCPP